MSRRRRWASVLLALAALLVLPGCVRIGDTLSGDQVACKEGDDGTPSNGIVLMAQAVTHRLLSQATTRRELSGIALIVGGVALLLWSQR